MAWANRQKIVVNPAGGGSRKRTRRNTGEQFSWVLNPGGRSSGKRSKMAAHKTKKKKKSWSAAHHHTGGRHMSKGNPKKRWSSHRSKPKTNWRRRRRNPAGMSITDLLASGIYATVGAVGSKLLTQAVLGASNTGIIGYLGNAVATAILGIAAGAFGPTRKHAAAVWIGGVVQIVLRVINDYTPYGSVASLQGVGDYQIMTTGFTSPQRYIDALHNANVEIPVGWGAPAPVAIQSSGVPASHASGMSGGFDQGFVWG